METKLLYLISNPAGVLLAVLIVLGFYMLLTHPLESPGFRPAPVVKSVLRIFLLAGCVLAALTLFYRIFSDQSIPVWLSRVFSGYVLVGFALFYYIHRRSPDEGNESKD